MSVILILILTSLAVAAGFLAAFIWAVRSGQYEDTQTPSLRILLDEEKSVSPTPRASAGSDAAAGTAFSLARRGRGESAPISRADSRPLRQG